jgi:hypothetical protein
LVETARNLIQEHLYPAVLAIILVCVLLASCTNGDAGSDLETHVPVTPRSTAAIGTATVISEAPSPTSFMRPTSISGPTVTTIPEPVSAAIARAAMDRDVSPSDVVMLRFLEKSWPSTALGCPEEGRSYAQIVTSGYAVAFSIVGELAFYHVDLTGAAIVECEGDDLE